MSKILVAYFSISGVTKRVAEKIAKATDGTLFEIEAETPYTTSDINWRNPESRASIEHNDQNSRPKIANKVTGMENYDTIFLGFPIWWYTCPNIIKTFLDSYGLDNKTIILFATSGGSNIDLAQKDLKAICPPSVKWLPGKVLNGNPDQKVIDNWVASLDI